MEKISTVRALVALWPTRQNFADDIGVPLPRVHKWVAANSVPSKHYRSIITAGCRRSILVSADDLIDIHCTDLSQIKDDAA